MTISLFLVGQSIGECLRLVDSAKYLMSELLVCGIDKCTSVLHHLVTRNSQDLWIGVSRGLLMPRTDFCSVEWAGVVNAWALIIPWGRGFESRPHTKFSAGHSATRPLCLCPLRQVVVP